MNWNPKEMAEAFPAVPEVFQNAMDRAYAAVRGETMREKAGSFLSKKRGMVWVAAAVLTLAVTAGIAVGLHTGVLDFLKAWYGQEAVQPDADALVQANLAQVSLPETELTIREALYDGNNLRVVYSVRVKALRNPLTEADLQDLSGPFRQAVARDGINMGGGDWFTLNGVEYTMTGGSTLEQAVGDQPGEMLVYVDIPLASAGIHPQADLADGTFEVGMALLTGPSHDQKLVTFRLSAGNGSGIFETVPGKIHAFGIVTATLLEARLSPVQAMIVLRIDIDGQASAAEAYNLMTAWKDAQLVNAAGERIGTAMEEAQALLPEGKTDGQRHPRIQYAFTPPASYPDQVFIAPFGFNDADRYGADMTQAVPLMEREEESK